MANERRIRAAMDGTITDNPLALGATTVHADALAGFPAVDIYHDALFVIDPLGAAGGPESVECTAHAAGTTAATISPTAREYPAGTPIICGPTTLDFVPGPDYQAGGNLGYDVEYADDLSGALPAGWAWVNQGGASYRQEYGAGIIVQPAHAVNDDHQLHVRALPVEPAWTLTVKMSIAALRANVVSVGPVLRDSTTGRFVQFAIFRYEVQAMMLNFNSPNSFNSHLAPARDIPYGIHHGTLWGRIRKNSAISYDFELSPNGRVWTPTASGANPSGFLTPNQIGWGGSIANGYAGEFACHHFRVR